MNKYEVIIVGAGPGGLACAKKLAENGKKVLVLEKNKVIGDKVCAGGFTGKEIDKIVPRNVLGRIFSKGIIHIGSKKIEIQVPGNSIGTCPRPRLGERMAKEVEGLGVLVKRETEVIKITDELVMTDKDEKYHYDYLVGADGSNSLVRKYLGLKTDKIGPTIQYQTPEIFKDLEVFMDLKGLGPTYIWIFPHDDFTEIGTGAYLKLISFKKVKEYFDHWIEKKGIDLKNAKVRSAPINCDYRGFCFGNIFLIGDAAGFTDAFTGEGIYPAVVSGKEAAEKIIDPLYSLDHISELLREKHKKEKPLRYYEKFGRFSKYANPLLCLMLKSRRFQRKLIRAYLY